MLDFRRHRRASKNFGPALERRLLVLLVGVGLVALLIVGAGNPRAWRWFVPDRPDAARQQRVARVPDRVVIGAVDDDPTGNAEAEAPDAADEPLFPGVRADYLRAVRDDTEFRPQESDGWFHLFALLARTPDKELVEASQGRVSYVQLDQQPRAYRGRVVTVGGVARAAKRITAPQNAFAVGQYYQVWLQPNRERDELIVVYVLDLPEAFPLGPQIEAACSATGFFFKRWAYPSRGGITTAPLLVAKTVDWQAIPAAEAPPPAQTPAEQLMTAIVAALLLAAVALVFVAWRGRTATQMRRTLRQHEAGDEKSVGAALASLDEDRPEEAS